MKAGVRAIKEMNRPEKVAYITGFKPKDNKEFYEKFWFKYIATGIVLILRIIPPFQRYIENSASWMLGMISIHERKGEYEQAMKLARAGLEKCQSSTDALGKWDWWQFMCHAAHVAHKLNMSEERERLISIAENYGKTVEGYYPACASCYFSRWRYEQGDYDAAIEYAQEAKSADKEYAESDFLLGWYALFVKQDNPIEYFKSAIRKDKTYLGRITHDPALKPFRNIIEELKEFKVA